MSGDYWQLTIDVLQNEAAPLVDKPKLQEKHLTRPPFRFLHDVITAVQRTTGFAPGLFDEAELDGKSIQDKDAKVTYLQKIIDVVSLVLNEPVPAKPLKIVAGLEPENTNVFLQMLGTACRLSNGSDAVQRVRGRANATPSAAPPPEAAEGAARPASRASSNQRASDGTAGTAPPPDPPAATTRAKEPSSSRQRRQSGDRPSRSSRSSRDNVDVGSSRTGRKDKPGPAAPPAPEAATPPPRAAAAESPASSTGAIRPQSARKAPPKASPPPQQQAAGSAALPSQTERRGAADVRGSVAAAAPTRPVRVMAEGAAGDSDDEVEVVHETAPGGLGAARNAAAQQGRGGVLVRDILDAEQDLKSTGPGAGGTGGEAGGTGIILKRLGKPAAAGAAGGGGPGAGLGGVRTTDTAALREMVQRLCQSTHPLAKTMDYLQEDLENMAKEYRFWQSERRVFAERLAAEQRMAGGADGLLAGATAQAQELDGQIKQAQDRILGIKAQVLRNEETISKLLTMAVGR